MSSAPEPPAQTGRPSYHHGGLRDALIAACLELLEDEGIGAVSLRRLARAAGVSPRAPYHHFRDRAALLAAVAERGFVMLHDRLLDARASTRAPARALPELLAAYVGFARTWPALFRLMFRPELSRPAGRNSPAGDAAYAVLVDVVEECQRAGVAPDSDSQTLAALFWATAHGLAALWLDGPLDQHGANTGTPAEQLVHHIGDLLQAMLVGAAHGGSHPD